MQKEERGLKTKEDSRKEDAKRRERIRRQ